MSLARFALSPQHTFWRTNAPSEQGPAAPTPPALSPPVAQHTFVRPALIRAQSCMPLTLTLAKPQAPATLRRTQSQPRPPFLVHAKTPDSRPTKLPIAGRLQAHHVLEAIDNHDVDLLRHIRDTHIDLLFRAVGGVTPLIYAMRQSLCNHTSGKASKTVDMAYLLLGFLSRWLNGLDEAELAKERKQPLLRALKGNLQWAIAFGVDHNKTRLIAAYLEVLVMSEGDAWVAAHAADIAHTLRVDGIGQAFCAAYAIILAFVRRSGASETSDACLDAYIFNASKDLLLLGCALEQGRDFKSLPLCLFGRDDNILRAFCDASSSASGFSSTGKVTASHAEAIVAVLQNPYLNSDAQKMQALKRLS